MKNIIAFAGSNSSNSINKKLAIYASEHLDGVNVKVLDFNTFEMPIYSADREQANGQPKEAKEFVNEIKNSDGIILSLPEYNGAYTGAFKNVFDWASRVEQKTFLGKPMLLMAASPGGRGGASVLAMAKDRFPRHDANIVEMFSFPKFNDNFKEGKIIDDELNSELKSKVKTFQNSL